jgi:hypothetical protein
MSKSYNFCNNCGKSGHAFHQCKHPITSIGIITFRASAQGVEYLLIRRKDSLGYVDFMRGKYPLYNRLYLRNIFNAMTIDEKKRLIIHYGMNCGVIILVFNIEEKRRHRGKSSNL